MKHILMLATGGTIASKESGRGLSPAITSEEILSYVPSLGSLCRVEAVQLMNLDSTNVGPAHWLEMAGAIRERYDRYDGFVITHGTDTMAYTAAALSYLIQASPKPIVITGSQKSICLHDTDARMNLYNSFLYAADDDSQGVNLVFDGKVIVGTRAKKEHAKSYNAFSSINFPYLAVIQDGILVRYIPEIPCRHAVKFYYDMKASVYVLKLIPGMKPDILSYLFEHYDCLVIESFGVGGIPQTLVQEFYQEMEKWSGKGKFVVMTTQVANEGSNMTVYEVGKKVKQDFNMIEAYDMTLEAVITKLMWLMGREEQDMQKAFYTQINHDILFTKRG